MSSAVAAPAPQLSAGRWTIALPLAHATVAVVDLLRGTHRLEPAPAPGSPAAALGARLGGDAAAAELAALALAETRLAAQPDSLWALDAALAAGALATRLGLDGDGGAELGALADARAGAGVEQLARVPPGALASGGFDLRDELLARLAPLRDRLGDGADAFDAWRAALTDELVLTLPREREPLRVAASVTLPAGPRRLPVPPALVEVGLVEPGGEAVVETLAGGGCAAALTPRESARRAYVEAAAAWSRTQCADPLERDLGAWSRALAVLGAHVRWATGARRYGLGGGERGPELPPVWICAFDRESGAVTAAVRLEPDADGILRAALPALPPDAGLLLSTEPLSAVPAVGLMAGVAPTLPDAFVQAGRWLVGVAGQLADPRAVEPVAALALPLLLADGGA
ncbi:MAG TPA: hypothetical protein VFU94_07870 [Conexibacter sp.]|nr:hypothetical protein [Conexibacter sp.]